jgi:hypothetical protein
VPDAIGSKGLKRVQVELSGLLTKSLTNGGSPPSILVGSMVPGVLLGVLGATENGWNNRHSRRNTINKAVTIVHI